MKHLCIYPIVTLLFILAYPTSAANLNTERHDAWETYKQTYIESYKGYVGYGLVFDSSVGWGVTPDGGDYAVSEGVGYGLLLAATHNDQVTFNKILDAANREMWNGSTYNWKVDVNGNTIGYNGATDADEDIAMALIMAHKKQAKGKWKTNREYKRLAQKLINNIYDHMTVDGYVKPGDVFGGPEELNLSYFAPAYYRVFDKFERTPHDWRKVIDTQYDILERVTAQHNGIIPDWCDQYGNATTTGRPHNMTYDAIRVPWRIALDYQWFGSARAKRYLNKAVPYVLSKGGVSQVKMYDIYGNPMEYHNELTVAMWGAGAKASDVSKDTKQQFVQELKSFYNPTEKSFNAAWQPAKYYYFNQSLALLGSEVIDKHWKKPIKHR